MFKRVSWKKGMRLTDEVLSMSDNCTLELVEKAFILSAGGNMGLFPHHKPFNLSVDINKNIVDVVSINCLGITRDGSLIDVCYDTNYTNSIDTRTSIPNANEDIPYILCITSSEEWRDTNDGMCEPLYTFIVIEENSAVPANALPIARIVYDEYCWRTDDINFTPPCLYLSSLGKYEELYSNFKQLLKRLDEILPHKFLTESKDALKIFWPIIQQLSITIDKEKDFMTPMTLLSNVQKYISGFLLACSLDDYINIGEPEVFQNYVRTPYNFKDAYQTIKKGIELCDSIYKKIEEFDLEEPAPKTSQNLQTPTIDKSQLKQKTSTNRIKIQVQNVSDDATLFYALNDSNSFVSTKGNTITISTHFNNKREPEPDEVIQIKIKTEFEGRQSPVSTHSINVTKDYKYVIPI